MRPHSLRCERLHIIHTSVAFDIFEQNRFIHFVIEGDIIEFKFAFDIFAQRFDCIFFFDDVLRKINDLEDAFEAETMLVEKSTGALTSPCKRAVQLTEIRTEGNDGANGEDIGDDEVAAKTVNERRAYRRDQTKDDEE
jgi:hypothetical protein